MSGQQTAEPQLNRFEALCAQIGEYDHLPAAAQEHDYRSQISITEDQEADLDASILAGLVSP